MMGRVRVTLFSNLAAVAGAVAAMAAGSAPSSAQLPFAGSPDLKLPTASQATGLNAADFNGDGRLDLIFLSGETSTISLLLAQPGPKFAVAKRIDLPAGASASGLALGDLNEDGQPDLAVCHHDSAEVWLFFGKGDGTFLPPQKVPVPVTKPHCHAIVAADLNRDHHLDLVLAESSDNCVWIFLGDGKGKFAKSPGSPISTGRHPYVVAAADFNRDGNPDIATPNWFGKSVGILLGDGKGAVRSAAASTYQGVPEPTAIAAGELTGDQNPDLVVGNNGTRGLQLLVGDGKGGFRPGVELHPTEPCFGPTLADLNGDGRLDVVCTSTNGALTLSYWLNRGDGEFSEAHSLACPGGANALCVADMDHDGVPDLCVAPEEQSPILVWLGRR